MLLKQQTFFMITFTVVCIQNVSIVSCLCPSQVCPVVKCLFSVSAVSKQIAYSNIYNKNKLIFILL